MNGSGLIQVLVTLAVILLGIYALGRAYRKPAGGAQGDGRLEKTAPEGGQTDEPDDTHREGGAETQDDASGHR